MMKNLRNMKVPAVVIAVVAATAVTAMTNVAPSYAAQRTNGSNEKSVLAVSDKSDRSNARALDGTTLSGTKWIYVKNPKNASRVAFFIDQPDLARVHKIENVKPFDLMGTKADGNAAGLDTVKLRNGKHTISAVLFGPGQSTKNKKLVATFTIDNESQDSEGSTPPVSQPPATEPPASGDGSNGNDDDGQLAVDVALTGAAEVPGPGDVDGSGRVQGEIEIDRNLFCYTLSVKGLDKVTAAHIHRGAAGAEGPVVAELQIPAAGSVSGAVEACHSIPADVVQRIVANPVNYYVNVHTTAFPKGAIRGQLSR